MGAKDGICLFDLFEDVRLDLVFVLKARRVNGSWEKDVQLDSKGGKLGAKSFSQTPERVFRRGVRRVADNGDHADYGRDENDVALLVGFHVLFEGGLKAVVGDMTVVSNRHSSKDLGERGKGIRGR